MAWQKSDPEVVAQRVSEARIELVFMLTQRGYSDQRTADMINDHFDELATLGVSMEAWSPRVLAQAMCYRMTRDDAKEVM